MYVKKNGVYDKLIIAHSFKEDLENNKLSLTDDQIEDFNPILTTGGICYTFNSQTLSEIWRQSLVTTTFEDLFPSDNVEKCSISTVDSYRSDEFLNFLVVK